MKLSSIPQTIPPKQSIVQNKNQLLPQRKGSNGRIKSRLKRRQKQMYEEFSRGSNLPIINRPLAQQKTNKFHYIK